MTRLKGPLPLSTVSAVGGHAELSVLQLEPLPFYLSLPLRTKLKSAKHHNRRANLAVQDNFSPLHLLFLCVFGKAFLIIMQFYFSVRWTAGLTLPGDAVTAQQATGETASLCRSR